MTFTFWKYHGLGNDFVIVDHRKPEGTGSMGDWSPEKAQKVLDRHRGIGGDGVLLMEDSTEADFRMVIYNADGSRPEMCGNGLRCFVRYLYERGHTDKKELSIETDRGVLGAFIHFDEAGSIETVRIDMGQPILERELVPMTGGSGPCIEEPISIEGHSYPVTAVSMGNPHMITFTPFGEQEKRLSPLLERHPLFPNRTNVEFVEVLSPTKLKVVVFERGCGFTQACGTGACAVAVAAVLTKRSPANQEIEVLLPGGPLWIEVPEDMSTVWMRGAAIGVFQGQWEAAL